MVEGQSQIGAKPYEAPKLTVHGSLSEVTAASILGVNIDQTIPAGTSVVGIIGRLSL